MRNLILGTSAFLAAGLLIAPGTANAWWARGGFGGGVVFFAPPVVVAPPPPVVVYAPPPPPAYYAARRCDAGPYVCPLDRPTPVGAGCGCPTNGGWIGGRAR